MTIMVMKSMLCALSSVHGSGTSLASVPTVCVVFPHGTPMARLSSAE